MSFRNAVSLLIFMINKINQITDSVGVTIFIVIPLKDTIIFQVFNNKLKLTAMILTK